MSIKRHSSQQAVQCRVEHGGVVYVAGQVADDLTCAKARPSSVEEDRRHPRRAGTGKSDSFRHVWVTDIRNATDESRLEAWADPANLPARATVEAKLPTRACCRNHGDLRQVGRRLFRHESRRDDDEERKQLQAPDQHGDRAYPGLKIAEPRRSSPPDLVQPRPGIADADDHRRKSGDDIQTRG